MPREIIVRCPAQIKPPVALRRLRRRRLAFLEAWSDWLSVRPSSGLVTRETRRTRDLLDTAFYFSQP